MDFVQNGYSSKYINLFKTVYLENTLMILNNTIIIIILSSLHLILS